MGLWLRWIGQWALYWLWWAGVWIALFILFTVVLLPVWPWKSVGWLAVALAAISATLVVRNRYLNAPASDESLQGSEDEYPYDVTVPDEKAKEEWGWNAIIGMFCGPVFVLLLQAVTNAFAARLGYIPPETGAFGLGLLVGMWLGAFTWEALGGLHTPRQTRAFQLTGGVGGLLAVVAIALIKARGPEGELQIELLKGALFVLSIPLLWALILVFGGASPVFGRGSSRFP